MFQPHAHGNALGFYLNASLRKVAIYVAGAMTRCQNHRAKKLFFIEKVINSCVTLDQLYSAGGWAATVIEQYHKHELDRLSQLLNLFLHIEMHNVVNEYFFLKQDIINLVVERKMEDIDRQEDTENIEND